MTGYDPQIERTGLGYRTIEKDEATGLRIIRDGEQLIIDGSEVTQVIDAADMNRLAEKYGLPFRITVADAALLDEERRAREDDDWQRRQLQRQALHDAKVMRKNMTPGQRARIDAAAKARRDSLEAAHRALIASSERPVTGPHLHVEFAQKRSIWQRIGDFLSPGTRPIR